MKTLAVFFKVNVLTLAVQKSLRTHTRTHAHTDFDVKRRFKKMTENGDCMKKNKLLLELSF